MSVAFALAKPAPWWRPPSRADRYALLILLGLPVLVFAVPAALGHPAVAADNLIQNYPLRVLTGRQLASGHLPMLNPLADSGTPLLGGMNAGSLFPLTLIFAVLPGMLAWVINLVAVYAAAGVGLYALARYHGLRSAAALLGALSYAYVGAMTGQLVHLGVVQGFAMLPWAILVMLVLAERVRERGPLRDLLAPVLALSALWGLTWLTGEPRAIAEMELLGLIVGPFVLLVPSRWRPGIWAERWRYVGALAVSLIWGVLLGLAQVITGWSYISVSQRTNLTYGFFGSGSLAVKWSALWFVPDIFGGNGILHQPHYFATYNLPEVTGYAGLVALMAMAAYAAQLVGRPRRWALREVNLYGFVGLVGVWATWGYYTPLGHLFALIPLYDSTRLQSRNVILLDLAASVLLAWWLDRLMRRDLNGASLSGWRRAVTIVPALLGVFVACEGLFNGVAFLEYLGLPATRVIHVLDERPTLIAHLVVALLAIALVLVPRVRVRLVMGLVLVDALLFFAFCATGLSPGNVPITPSRTSAVGVLGATGRFAMVDPSGRAGDQFISLGLPNTNVFTGLASIQGYGSLIDAHYGDQTGTHPLFQINPCQLERGDFQQLRLASLAISSDQLLNRSGNGPRYCQFPQASTSLSRYFGRVEAVKKIEIDGYNGARLGKSRFTLQLLGANGQPIGAPFIAPAGQSVIFALRGELAAGFTLSSPTPLRVGSTGLYTTDGHHYQLSTMFQQALSTQGWHLVRTTSDLAFLRADSVLPGAWVSPGSSAKVLSQHGSLWGDSWVRVNATSSTTLMHSMAWIPGWRASASEVGTSRVIDLTVHQSGLIQSVQLPAGNWLVHFHYRAPYVELGLIGSGLSGLGFLVALSLAWRSRRRKVVA